MLILRIQKQAQPEEFLKATHRVHVPEFQAVLQLNIGVHELVAKVELPKWRSCMFFHLGCVEAGSLHLVGHDSMTTQIGSMLHPRSTHGISNFCQPDFM
jgi:hypothetical protein